jgi:dethiobiotin synthetase
LEKKMATALYITSTETYSGKTALAVGIAQRMRHDGLRVGYFKPLSFSAAREEQGPVDEDSRVIKRLLGLKEATSRISPTASCRPTTTSRPTKMWSSSRAPTTWPLAA